jgi:predicted HAD superfamily Cof-like phosphohydrolase
MSNQRQPADGRAVAVAPGETELSQALIDATDAIADMAQRVQLNGPEVTYASEKLGHALYKSAEALALCGVELEEVVSEAHRGYRHGLWIVGEER